MIAIILLFVLLCIILFSWITTVWDLKSMKNIQGPIPLPIIGSGHLFLGNSQKLLKTLTNLMHEYGDVCCVYILSQRYVVLTHPKYIQAIVSSPEHITKGVSYNLLKPWLGQGLLTATGNRWRTHRKFLTPAFHYVILQEFLSTFTHNNKILIKKLKNVSDGYPVDLFEYIPLLALDNITEAIMGVSVNAQNHSESEYVKANEEITHIISMRMRNAFLNKDVTFNLTSLKTRQDKLLSFLHGQSKKVISLRQEELKNSNITKLQTSDVGLKNKHAFLDLLLLSEIDGKKIDEEHVREEVDTFMFEGHDTTSSGLVYSLFCISNYKHVQDKIYQEQQKIFGDDMKRDATFNDLNQMKYLEMVIKETLRLYPSVPYIQRIVTEDTAIKDIVIKKDTAVIINIFDMQRRADIFEDPLEFRPERFEGNLSNPFEWLAFSAGPRNCIGQKFAMMQMKVVLSSIVKNFKLSPSGLEPLLVADLVLRSANGVHVKLTPRI